MNLNIKNLHKNVKENFKEGDKIIMNADAEDPESDMSIKRRKKRGIIKWIGPYFTLVDLGQYHTCIHNHEMLTDTSIRRIG